ncbi:MAG: pantetheine-phosphate adenylyltransferase [bacterium]
MTKAIYPGSFDPITYGHLDLIERALTIFDHINVAVVENPDKDPLFSSEKRADLIREVLTDFDHTSVDTFGGLLVEYVRYQDCHVILRGLRALSDFEYEFQMSMMNKRLAEEIETVYMMPAEDHSFVSSSLVKEVGSLDGEIETLVPEPVQEALRERYS